MKAFRESFSVLIAIGELDSVLNFSGYALVSSIIVGRCNDTGLDQNDNGTDFTMPLAGLLLRKRYSVG